MELFYVLVLLATVGLLGWGVYTVRKPDKSGESYEDWLYHEDRPWNQGRKNREESNEDDGHTN